MQSVIVLGGGSSGLLSALMVKQAFPNFDVTVIKSDSIGIIGVGEGSTEHWKTLCQFLNIDVNDAVRHCGATMKVGIHFKDWGVPDYYHSVIDDYLETNGESFPFYQKLISTFSILPSLKEPSYFAFSFIQIYSPSPFIASSDQRPL